MNKRQNGLALRQQSQALTTETERPVKAALFSVDHAVKVIRSQQAADIAFDLILTDTQQADLLADAAVTADNPRAFLAQIQKRIVRSHGKR